MLRGQQQPLLGAPQSWAACCCPPKRPLIVLRAVTAPLLDVVGHMKEGNVMQMQALEAGTSGLDRGEAMMHLVPLVEVCNHSERIFADAIQSSASSDFRSFAGRIRQLLNEYGFQLRIELQRLSSDSTGVWVVDSRLMR